MNSDTPNYEELESRLNSYFGNGGLFNPEYMEHDKVRDLLRDIRPALRAAASLQEFNEQLTVQLAGCSVAALGGTKEPAIQGMYGWSPAYQDVLNLRLEHDRLQEALAEAQAAKEDVERLLDATENKHSKFVEQATEQHQGKVRELEARLAECERLLADFRTLYPDVRMLHDGFLVNSDGGSDWDKTVATKFMRLGIRIDTAMSQNGGSEK